MLQFNKFLSKKTAALLCAGLMTAPAPAFAWSEVCVHFQQRVTPGWFEVLFGFDQYPPPSYREVFYDRGKPITYSYNRYQLLFGRDSILPQYRARGKTPWSPILEGRRMDPAALARARAFARALRNSGRGSWLPKSRLLSAKPDKADKHCTAIDTLIRNGENFAVRIQFAGVWGIGRVPGIFCETQVRDPNAYYVQQNRPHRRLWFHVTGRISELSCKFSHEE